MSYCILCINDSLLWQIFVNVYVFEFHLNILKHNVKIVKSPNVNQML